MVLPYLALALVAVPLGLFLYSRIISEVLKTYCITKIPARKSLQIAVPRAVHSKFSLKTLPNRFSRDILSNMTRRR